MTNYQQYQRYRVPRQGGSASSKRWMYIVGAIVLLLLIWWMRSTVTSDSAPEADSTNSVVDDANTNATTEEETTTETAAADGYDIETCTRAIASVLQVEGKLALTFNGVSSAGTAEEILQILADKNIKADFFITGSWVENNPELAIKVRDGGHGLYNLGFEHVSFSGKSAADIQADFEKTDDIFTTTIGRSPTPFFRPPFGAYDDTVFEAAKQYGYCTVIWSFDSLDWQADLSNEEVRDRIFTEAKAGSVLVLQMSNTTVPAILAEVIDGLTERGLAVTPLLDLLTTPAESN